MPYQLEWSEHPTVFHRVSDRTGAALHKYHRGDDEYK
jgi:hypothetical protein